MCLRAAMAKLGLEMYLAKPTSTAGRTGMTPAAKLDGCLKRKPIVPRLNQRSAQPPNLTIGNLLALPHISEMFFKPIDFSFPDLPAPFAANMFAWPRERRVLTPAIFWPYELEDNYEVDRNTKSVPGFAPGPSASPANLNSSALDPGSSPGTDGKEVKPP